MAKVEIVTQPTGLINGRDWPEPGETLELPDDVAESMAAAGTVKLVKAAAKKVESRPAPTENVEKRAAAKKSTPGKS
jgi:hypothetical protein